MSKKKITIKDMMQYGLRQIIGKSSKNVVVSKRILTKSLSTEYTTPLPVSFEVYFIILLFL